MNLRQIQYCVYSIVHDNYLSTINIYKTNNKCLTIKVPKYLQSTYIIPFIVYRPNAFLL